MIGYIDPIQYRRAVAPLVEAVAAGATLPTVADATPPTDLTFLSKPFHMLDGLFEVFSIFQLRSAYFVTVGLDYQHRRLQPADRFAPVDVTDTIDGYTGTLLAARLQRMYVNRELDVHAYALLERGYIGSVFDSKTKILTASEFSDLYDGGNDYIISDISSVDPVKLFDYDSYWFNPIYGDIFSGTVTVDNEVYTVSPVSDTASVVGGRLAFPRLTSYTSSGIGDLGTYSPRPYVALVFKTNATGGVVMPRAVRSNDRETVSPIIVRLRPTFTYDRVNNVVTRVIDADNFFARHPHVDVVVPPAYSPVESLTAGEAQSLVDTAKADYYRWFQALHPDTTDSGSSGGWYYDLA